MKHERNDDRCYETYQKRNLTRHKDNKNEKPFKNIPVTIVDIKFQKS